MQPIEVKAFLCEECSEYVELGNVSTPEGDLLAHWDTHMLRHLVILPAHACSVCHTVYPFRKAALACCR